jgi:uncharacterized protein (TIGR02452 family)
MLQLIRYRDSIEMAQARHQELQLPREQAIQLGNTAVHTSEIGAYRSPSGKLIEMEAWIAEACEAKRSVPPEETLLAAAPPAFELTEVEIANETTLQAGWDLVNRGFRPLALNFANGLHPGGGFLSGSLAQEETLCRSSALYATLKDDPMYAHHLRQGGSDASDWMILSPQVPVFRQDDGTELEVPWRLDFITSAAPVAPYVGRARAAALLAQRIRRLLEIAQAFHYTELVLGAWGCGAFGNDPQETAQAFHQALSGPFSGAFRHIRFAITDWSPKRRFLQPFREVFEG